MNNMMGIYLEELDVEEQTFVDVAVVFQDKVERPLPGEGRGARAHCLR
jgi:hypothetical protein